MLLSAVVGDGNARFGGRKLRRCAMLVSCADEQHVVANLTPVPGMNVGRQERSGQVAEVFDSVDVRKCAGDQRLLNVSHVQLLESVRWESEIKKAQIRGPGPIAARFLRTRVRSTQ